VSEKFKTKDLGKLSFILGIKVEHSIDGTVRLSQKSYIEKIMLKFNLENTKSTDTPIQPNHNLTRDLRNEKSSLRKLFDVTTYRQALGSLIYLMTCTRPDIAYSIGVLARFMQEPRELHWRFMKRLLSYVKTTMDYRLIYKKSNNSR
jgi:hypothetical protein